MTIAKYPQSVSRLRLIHQGKTRDTYATRPGIAKPPTRLVYASDRISTHDIVHLSAIPHKGEVLTALTIFWLANVLRGMPNHLVAYGPKIYEYLDGDPSDYPSDLHVRSIVVRDLEMIPVEFIFRAYVAGSLYRDYVSKGLPNPYGIEMPLGTALMTPCRIPLFTPTSKSDVKDEPLHWTKVQSKHADAIELARDAYRAVRRYANDLGIEIVDWKGEIGFDPRSRTIQLADEIGTPDCCRFCELDQIRMGSAPAWLDKQIVRDEAERLWNGGEKIPLMFSDDAVEQVSDTYLRVFERITGMPLKDFQVQFMQ